MNSQSKKFKKFERQQLLKPQKIKGGASQEIIVEDQVLFLNQS